MLWHNDLLLDNFLCFVVVVVASGGGGGVAHFSLAENIYSF